MATSAPPATLELDRLLREATILQASDLHVLVGVPPKVRVNGQLRPLRGYDAVTAKDVDVLCRESIATEQLNQLERDKSLDFAHKIPGVARFRCAYYYQQGVVSIVCRRLSESIPTLADVAAPNILLNVAQITRGLLLVTGPTGSGKSTTLAAFCDVINETRDDNIITLEDPIEYLHPPKRCNVNQREVGVDVPTFPEGLRRALRQDPDVVLVGEMRDLETTSIALTAAETGHLVLGTLHTSTADSTINRIIDQYPPEQQQQVRVQLAGSLLGVVCQTLLPKADGTGRVAMHEVMWCTTAIRNSIRNQRLEMLRQTMGTSSQDGMQTIDAALAWNVANGIVSRADALTKVVDLGEFERGVAAIEKGQTVVAPQLVTSDSLAAHVAEHTPAGEFQDAA